MYREQETTVRSPKKGHRDGERREGDREGGTTKTTQSLARQQGGMISEEGPKGHDSYLVR